MKRKILIGAVVILATIGIGISGTASLIKSNLNDKKETSLKAKKTRDAKFKKALSKLGSTKDSSNSSWVVLETPKGEESLEAQKNKYEAEIKAQSKAFAKQNSEREFMSYATDMFNRMVNGGDYAVASSWCSSSSDFESYLFSPRSYQILGEPFVGDEIASLDVRIESSNKGGQEITKTWDFSFKKSPDKAGRDWCLQLIS